MRRWKRSGGHRRDFFADYRLHVNISLFNCGIAYPIRAEIKGQGVGAIRYCIFSTGPFVEPIVVWDEPNLLKFCSDKILLQCRNYRPTMICIHHTLGWLFGFKDGGSFGLSVRLPDGHTMLEGTTWYYHNLWPAQYWQCWKRTI